MDATHLLITRFNIRFSGVASQEYPCDDKWHQHRFKIFERYSLPSVLFQTNQQFQWLICFNADLKETYREFIQRTESVSPNISFIFVEPEKSHLEEINNYISSNTETKHIITTRVDNDDIIAAGFVESIQRCYQNHLSDVENENLILNAPNGFQFETGFPRRISRISDYSCSPFMSIVSKREDAVDGMHVHKYKHLDWKGRVNTVDITDEPLWIQVIHSRNRANRILSLELTPDIKTDQFPVFKKIGAKATPNYPLWPLQIVITAAQRVYVRLNKLLQRFGKTG